MASLHARTNKHLGSLLVSPRPSFMRRVALGARGNAARTHASTRPTDEHTIPHAPQPVHERPFAYDAPSDADLSIAAKHVGRVAHTAIGVGHRCSAGKPQVLVWPPLRQVAAASGVGQVKADASLFFLTCPQLVHAVDLAERDGLIEWLQERVDTSQKLQEQMRAMNESVARARIQLLPDEWRERLQKDAALEQVRWIVFETGLAGVSPKNFTYVKCAHAQLADWLTRGDVNPLGPLICQRIENIAGIKVPDLGSLSCELYCECSNRKGIRWVHRLKPHLNNVESGG